MDKIKAIIFTLVLSLLNCSSQAANNFNTLDIPATVAITNCSSGAPIFYLNGVAHLTMSALLLVADFTPAAILVS